MTFLPVPENQVDPSKITPQQLERMKKMAEEMKKQGQGYQKTEMVSGWVVPKSKIERLAGALQTTMGDYKANQADDLEAQKQENAQNTVKNAMEAYARAIGGGTSQLPSGETVTWNQQPMDQAGKMYANMLMQNPDTASLGMQEMQNQMQTAQELKAYEQKRQLDAKYAAQRSTQTPFGGATGQLIERLMQETGMPFDEALYTVQTGFRQGTTYRDGQVSPMEGYGQSKGLIERQKNYMGTQGTEQAKIDVQNIQSLPKSNADAQQILNLIQGLRDDKTGMQAVVGAPNPFYGSFGRLGNIPGTPAANFKAKLDQLGGSQFLQAFETLKGGGQITEIEGVKATNAIARMQTAQSEEAFLQALDEFETIVKAAAERAAIQAQNSYVRTQNPYPSAKQQPVSPVDGVPMLTMEDLNGKYVAPQQINTAPPVQNIPQQMEYQPINRDGLTEYVPVQQNIQPPSTAQQTGWSQDKEARYQELLRKRGGQ